VRGFAEHGGLLECGNESTVCCLWRFQQRSNNARFMANFVSYLYVFVLPAGEVFAALLLGRFCLKRARVSRSHAWWCLGVALCGGAVLAGLALGWLYVDYANTESFGRLIILFAPALPAAAIAAGSPVIYAGLTLWGYRRPAFFDQFCTTPGQPVTVVSVAVLAIAAVIAIYLILPALMLLPYTSVSAEARTNIVTLYGYSRFTGNRDSIIVLENHQWPDYNPAFRGTLDWRGRAVLDVWHSATDTRAEGSITYYLPFEAAHYILNHGPPVRVNQRPPRQSDG